FRARVCTHQHTRNTHTHTHTLSLSLSSLSRPARRSGLNPPRTTALPPNWRCGACKLKENEAPALVAPPAPPPPRKRERDDAADENHVDRDSLHAAAADPIADAEEVARSLQVSCFCLYSFVVLPHML